MPGNPFRSDKPEGGGLLGGGGLRSDQWADDEHDETVQISLGAAASGSAAPASPAAAGAAPAVSAPAPASAADPVAAERSALPPSDGAGAAPPPPPVATASFIPPPMATQPPPVTGVPAGAWGTQPPQRPGVWGISSSQYDSSGPAGYPPPAGGYGAAPPGYQPQQWTGGYSDQPLTYTTFEQAVGGAAQRPLGCWGWGEQWACFIIGILIWPLWYVAVCWYCCDRKQSTDPRQRTPFILNCVASFVFTFIWVAIVVRETSGGWSCDGDGSWCW